MPTASTLIPAASTWPPITLNIQTTSHQASKFVVRYTGPCTALGLIRPDVQENSKWCCVLLYQKNARRRTQSAATTPARYAKSVFSSGLTLCITRTNLMTLNYFLSFMTLFGWHYFNFLRPTSVLIPSEHCRKINDSCLPLNPRVTPI